MWAVRVRPKRMGWQGGYKALSPAIQVCSISCWIRWRAACRLSQAGEGASLLDATLKIIPNLGSVLIWRKRSEQVTRECIDDEREGKCGRHVDR
jgi:hypothetical protein